MELENLYAILGVTPDDTENAIRRAFRKITRKCHPEVNPGDDEALVRYRILCKAYSVLGNKRSRSEYDRLGHEEFYRRYPEGEATGTEKGEDYYWAEIAGEGFIGNILGIKRTLRVGVRPEKGEDIQHFLVLDFFDVVRGRKSRIEIIRRTVCPACGGRGASSESQVEKCPGCGGTGVATQSFGPLSAQVECRQCRGSGRIIKRTCPVCRGARRVDRRQVVGVEIPAGVHTGSEIRIKGLGHEGLNGGQPGDLVLITRVEDNPGFQRKGDNIFSRVPVMFWEAALGGNIRIPTVDGEKLLEIPAGTQGHKRFKLAGLGIPNLKTGKRGDHFVEIELVVPAPVSEKERLAYLRLAEIFAGWPEPGRE